MKNDHSFTLLAFTVAAGVILACFNGSGRTAVAVTNDPVIIQQAAPVHRFPAGIKVIPGSHRAVSSRVMLLRS